MGERELAQSMKVENHLLVIKYPLQSIPYQPAQCAGAAKAKGALLWKGKMPYESGLLSQGAHKEMSEKRKQGKNINNKGKKQIMVINARRGFSGFGPPNRAKSKKVTF
jgi:hypothetical protein